MKTHKLWIIILIMFIEGSLATVASSTDAPPDCTIDCSETCQDYPSPQTCVCKEKCGIIKSPTNGTSPSSLVEKTYTFTDGLATVLRLDDFYRLSTSSCYLTFPDGTVIGSGLDDSAKGSLKLANSFSIYKRNRPCYWTLTYFTYEFRTDVTNLTEPMGVINNPFADDDYGAFTNRPNTHSHYILQTPGPEYVINVNVSHQNLGVPFGEINDQLNEVTTGDIVMVGSGPGVLSGDDTALYGSKSLETTRMRIFAEVAHVSLSYTSFQDVSMSFNYSFERAEELTTVIPTTVPTTPMPPGEDYFTFAAINGIPPKQSEAVKYEPVMKRKLAEIANQYAEEFMEQPLDYNITEQEVSIYGEKKCNSRHCDSTNCVAYNFSILYMDNDGNWLFSKEKMDDMVWQYREDFANLVEGYEGEPVCNENVQIDIVPYIILSVSVVVIGCIISLIVYRAGLGSSRIESKSKYKKENEERMDDERRRSSGNISFMGLGNTRGSMTSMASSRKFSMPFPSADKKPKKNVKYDMSGFKEFNPENSFGGEPVSLGLEKEMLGNKSAMKTYYSNEGYIPDEDAGHSRPTQQPWENQDRSSSESSSDNEDDGPSSFPPLGQNHDLARRQLQEKLATIQASDSEEEDDSDNDVVQFNRSPVSTELKASVVPVDVHYHPDQEGETIL